MIVSPSDTIGLLLFLAWLMSLGAVVWFAIRQRFGAFLKASAITVLSLLGTWLCLSI